MSTLFEKVWNAHAVRTLPSGQTQLFVGLHLVHEVTSPQAFDMLRQHGWGVAFPERTFATVDHIVPTSSSATAASSASSCSRPAMTAAVIRGSCTSSGPSSG
jgi:homoaconitase/3-isopropylmalate dehydratase large subunit